MNNNNNNDKERLQLLLKAVEESVNLAQSVLRKHDACLFDVLNPCWDNRPTDVVGRHWGADVYETGTSACVYCHAKGIMSLIGKALGARL